MGKKSYRKGRRGELAVAKILARVGRASSQGTAQRAGSDRAPDVLWRPSDGKVIAVEVKWLESYPSMNYIEKMLERARTFAEPAIVTVKRDRGKWLAVLALEDLVDLVDG